MVARSIDQLPFHKSRLFSVMVTMSKRDDHPTEWNTVIFMTWGQEEYSEAREWKMGAQHNGVKKWD